MDKLFLLILPLFLNCSFTDSRLDNAENLKTEDQASIYYFIRHAEKDTTNPDDKDPDLTEVGYDRADRWAKSFKNMEFDLIYSSDYKRTKNTAQIIADSQQKEVQIYDASKLNDEDFQKKTKGKKVLVVGHSNSNPQWVNYLLDEKKYSDIPEDESGSLFIVTIFPNGVKHSQVLYFN